MMATGIETNPAKRAVPKDEDESTVVRSLTVRSQHIRLTQVTLMDVTDRHNELVHERYWLLHPNDTPLSLCGNLFLIEDLVNKSGKILIKRAPLPAARPGEGTHDLHIASNKQENGFEIGLLNEGHTGTDPWSVLTYCGGVLERTRVLHNWQKEQRPDTAGHSLPRLLTNTWGDRSRDSRMTEDFISKEIDAAHELGADVVQLDDGWQKGTSSNSSKAKELGGVWDGFWNADSHFWDPHPDRFPRGLRPVVERASCKGIKIGLWFAPDSWNDFVNWRKDAACVLELFTDLGVEHFKVDGVVAATELAIENLQSFFKTVRDGSQGKVVFDLDITAGIRPGYFGAMEVGPLFVENRYTDWHSYWPHQTLRNLWKLSHWIDPQRLRMEFLNNARNTEKYGDDPLAPVNYAPDTLFAAVMFSNPLGWFEVSNLPSAYIESVSKLVSTWKSHREKLFSGTILPIGQEPDGFSYTGFVSVSDTQDSGYLLVFRERAAHPQHVIELPDLKSGEYTWDKLGSGGRITSQGGTVHVTIPKQLGFLFAQFTQKR